MALIRCEECGKEISDKSIKCVHCGCPINNEENKSVCSECGKQLKQGSNICDYCGYSVNDKGNKNKFKWSSKKIISLIVILIIFLIIYAIIKNNDVTGTYFYDDDEYLELYKNGECYYQHNDYDKYPDCSYRVISENQIRVTYKYFYDFFMDDYKGEKTYTETYYIQEDGNLKLDNGDIFYKK